jgi:hypothetical protein
MSTACRELGAGCYDGGMFTGAKATYLRDPTIPVRTVGAGELIAVYRQGDRDRVRLALIRATTTSDNDRIRAEANKLKDIHNNSAEPDRRLDFVVDEGVTQGRRWFVTPWLNGVLYAGAKENFFEQPGAPERKTGGQAYVCAVNKVGDRSNTRFALKRAKEAEHNDRIRAEASQLRAIRRDCCSPEELVPEVLEEGETLGICWFVMPWYDQNLAEGVRDLNGVDRLRWLARFARLVERFHTATGGLIVHHDIKAFNVLVAEQAPEKLLLADFAGARGLGRLHEDHSTVTGMPAFTAPYAPPEAGLPQGEQATMAADRFSLAASIFHLLTGRDCKAPGADPFKPAGQALTGQHLNARSGHLSDESAEEYKKGRQMALRDLLNPQGGLLIPQFDNFLNCAVVTGKILPPPPPKVEKHVLDALLAESKVALDASPAEVKAALDDLRADLRVALSIIPDHRIVAPGQLALRLDALALALNRAKVEVPAQESAALPERQDVHSTYLAAHLPSPSPAERPKPEPAPPVEEAAPPQREPVASVQAPRPLPRAKKNGPPTPPVGAPPQPPEPMPAPAEAPTPAVPPVDTAPQPPPRVVFPDPPLLPEPMPDPAEAPAPTVPSTPWFALGVAAGVVLLCLVAVGAAGALYVWSQPPAPAPKPVVELEPVAPDPPPPPWERSDPDYLALGLPEFVQLKADTYAVPKGDPDGTEEAHLVLASEVGLARTETPRRLYLSMKMPVYDTEQDFKGKGCGDLLPAVNTDEVPITCVSPLEIVQFLNRLSKAAGYDEVYTVDGTTITMNPKARGFRLPLRDEWVVGAWTWDGITSRPRWRAGTVSPPPDPNELSAVDAIPWSWDLPGWALAAPHGNAQELLWPGGDSTFEKPPTSWPLVGGSVTAPLDENLISTIANPPNPVSMNTRRNNTGFRIAWGSLAPTESP